MRRQVRRPWWVRAGLGVAFSAVLLYMAELALRLSGVGPAYRADLVGGWQMTPEMHAQRMTGTKEAHSFVVTTNKDGLRTSLPRPRSAAKRVAILGDSTVFGWGVDDGGTVADGLQRGLPGIEVLNAGQPGYSTTQIERFFQVVVAGYRPDLAVVFLPMHDHNAVLVSDREHLDGPRGLLSRVRVTLATHSRVYQWLRQQLFPLWAEPFLRPDLAGNEPRVPRVSAEERADNLDRMRETLAGWHGRLALGHLPFIGDFENGRAIDRLGAAEARAYAEQHDIAIIDGRECCGRGAEGLVLAFDPGHLTAKGNLAAGEYMAVQVAAALQSSNR